MHSNGCSFSEEDLIAKVISKNIPDAWVKDFKMFKIHLQTKIKDIISELTVLEEQIKVHSKPTQNNHHKKQFKNPCKLHNGSDPKNQKEMRKELITISTTTTMEAQIAMPN